MSLDGYIAILLYFYPLFSKKSVFSKKKYVFLSYSLNTIQIQSHTRFHDFRMSLDGDMDKKVFRKGRYINFVNIACKIMKQLATSR
jgi:hypothetical protein